MRIRDWFVKALSIIVHPHLSEGKKFALQVATLDVYGSMVAFGFYTCHNFSLGFLQLFYFNLLCFLLMFVGLFLLYKRHYDLGRILIHQIGLLGIFSASDCYGVQSGFEYYYLVSIMMPNVTFSLEELWKAVPLSLISCTLFLVHQALGGGLLFDPVPTPPEERVMALFIVTFFTVTVMAVVRWRLYHVQREIKQQQSELIHSSSLIALGEMSGGIAHEINNPLQSLSLQVMVIREKFKDMNQLPENIHQHLGVMDDTIFKMGRMVQGLKDLSRKDSPVNFDQFHFSKVLEDVLIISSERLKEADICLYIYGDSDLKLLGNSVQISQVFINLLNNAVDAVKGLGERWIRIEIQPKNSFLQVTVTDSGEGISDEVVEKMMKPFYTTKDPSVGTGLGLSISKSIVEKNRGRLYYDSMGPNTRFVVLLPMVNDEPAY